jgi:hypothetical protein
MRVSDNSNAAATSSTSLGAIYANDTGLDGQTVFTGSRRFQVKEIEVFEISETGLVSDLLKRIEGLQNSSEAKVTMLCSRLSTWTGAMDSLIVWAVPEIFAEFSRKRFSLLWRGSRDGFGCSVFHGRCDGHAPTLTVILDTKGNVFGGFTPVKWESREWNGKVGNESNCWKADGRLRTFLFTLKNPHGIPARRFALKAGKKDKAIQCHPQGGPCFGGVCVFGDTGTDMFIGRLVRDYADADMRSFTSLGDTYSNDTGLDGKTVFTGSKYFQAEEIEVFEITDSTAFLT